MNNDSTVYNGDNANAANANVNNNASYQANSKDPLKIKTRRVNAIRAASIIFTMIAIASGFIAPDWEYVDPFRIVMYCIVLPMSLFFLIKSFIDAGKLPKKMDEH